MNKTEIFIDELIRIVRAKPGFENVPLGFIKIYIAVKLGEYLLYLDEIEHTNRFEKCMAAVTERVNEKFEKEKREVFQNEEVI